MSSLKPVSCLLAGLLLLGRSEGAYGLEASELRSVSRRLHAKAQTARRKGLAKKFTGDLEAIVGG